MEKILSAAALHKGKLYIGATHGDIRTNIEYETGSWPCVADVDEGFITDQQRFVSRREAAEIAFAAGQIDRPLGILNSYDLKTAEPVS